MAETTKPPEKETKPIAVVSPNPNWHSRYPILLTIVNTELSLYDDSYSITNLNRNVFFNFKFKYPIFGPRALVDSAGKTLLTFQEKKQTFGTKWIVFRGDSTNPKDIIFSTKRSKDTHPEKLDVFMGNEEKESCCDYKINGNWFDQSCTIYARDGNTTIARMYMEKRLKLSIGKERFGVLVYPYVDMAFVAALVMIMKLTRDNDVRKVCPNGW